MCGIAGAVEIKNRELIDFSVKSKIHKSIERRGPDFYCSSSYSNQWYTTTLAHSRLSIIDLTASSNQPYTSEDENFILTFNGEIYNYIEIREELKTKNHIFKTTGDVEVLLKSWIEWGEACLDKFNGMFAFSILDKKANKLYLVRDRFGVKPLAYTHLGENSFLFSSSVEALGEYANKGLDLKYISQGYNYGVFEGFGDNTIYNGVNYLPAGHILIVDMNESKLKFDFKQWYDLSKRVEDKILELSEKSFPQLIDYIQTIFSESINIRMRSDVPLAISISGGVDSTSIAAIAHSLNKNVQGFCFGHPDDKNSEGQLAKMLSEKIGIDIHYIWLSNDTTEIVKAYEDTFNAQELPFLGLSVIAQNQVYQKVKEHGVKVLLGGQGADEIFAGYRKFFIQSLKNAVYTNRWSDAISTMYSLGNMLLHEAKYFQTYWQIKDRYFKDSVKGRGYLDFLPEVKIDLIGASDVSLRKRQIQDVQNYSLPTLLRNEDRNSMFHSIESRLPFMDYRLVEAAISLPQALKIKNGFGKWILRDIMKEKVPYAILFNKRKRGFDVTQDWMNNGLKAHLKNSINNNMSHLKKYEIKVDEKLFKEIDEKNEQFMIADLLLLDYLSRK